MPTKTGKFPITYSDTSGVDSEMIQIELYLQWPTNRKSYTVYRTVPFSVTLNDPKPRFQGHTII